VEVEPGNHADDSGRKGRDEVTKDDEQQRAAQRKDHDPDGGGQADKAVIEVGEEGRNRNNDGECGV